MPLDQPCRVSESGLAMLIVGFSRAAGESALGGSVTVGFILWKTASPCGSNPPAAIEGLSKYQWG